MAKKKKSKVVEDSSLELELEGNVYIVEKKNGKITERSPLDGEVVLKCLLKAIEEGIDLIEEDSKNEP